MIISFVNAKGGVGKTTLAVHFAVWLHDQGKKVAFIDADRMRLSSGWLAEAEQGIATTALTTQDEILNQADAIAENADYLIIDGPAGDTDLTRAILLKSSLAFLPCAASELDLKGTRLEIQVVRQAQSLLKGLPRAFFIPNRVDPKQVLTRELLELTGEQMGIPFTKSIVRQRPPYADAPGQKSVVSRMGFHARFAAEEIATLFTELKSYAEKETGNLVANA
jgi:chromosome partitioning protein